MHAHSSFRRRVAALSAIALGVGLVPMVAAAPSAGAAPTELFFSEYVEGTSNNKAVEIYNGTGAPVDLSAGQYAIRQYSNGAPTAGLTVSLTGTIAPGDVFVFAHSSAAPAILAQADLTSSAGLFNGDDALALAKGGANLDIIGQIGTDPGAEWGTGLTSTADNTLRRRAGIEAGDLDGTNAFDPSEEWDGFPVDTFDGLGTYGAATPVDAAPTVASTSPANLASNVAVDSPVSVTFSEPVTVGASAFGLSCSVSGARTVAVSGGPSTYTLTPSDAFAVGDACTLTVTGAQVADVDPIDPPDTMAADHVVTFTTLAADACEGPITAIPAIQGSGDTVAIAGPVTTEGVVVGDYEGASPNLRGFFIQARSGDGDPATSDGIFAFEGSNKDSVQLGDVVRVTGSAGENQGQSQISLSSDPVVCGTDTVTPTDVTFPVATGTTLEQYEGMLVRLPQAMTVSEHFQLGRFGQVTLSQGGRLQQPTNVVAPGPPAVALQASNDLRKIVLDDASQAQNPDPIPFARGGRPLSASNTLRGGDTATGIVGVLNYTWGGNAASPNAYRIRPIGALDGSVTFEPTNPRPTASPTIDAGTRVVGMNLLNYFNTFTGCRGGEDAALLDCRGAENATELDRQTAKTVSAISGTKADVVAFMEMENDGYGPTSAESYLVGQLNTKDGAGTWAFIDPDRATGEHNSLGSDAIKVGLLYKPDRVTTVGTTAVLNTVDFVNAGTDSPKNRPALAQAFRDNVTGGVLVGVANHLKSKGSGCAAGGADDDKGDGQGNCNGARTYAANALAAWLAGDPTRMADPDVLILGDLNSYAKEDPIVALERAGFHNLIAEAHGDAAYSYVFDGQWGYLDHALGSDSLRTQVAGVEDWHINADEPSVLDYNTNFKSPGQVTSLYAPDEFRISDHDPVVVGLNLRNDAPLIGAVTGPTGPVAKGASVTVSASFTDADRSDNHTATIDWGDGTTSPATVVETNGTGTLRGSHSYARAGLDAVSVTVTDSAGNIASRVFGRVVVYDPTAGSVAGLGAIASPAGALKAQPTLKTTGALALLVGYPRGATVPTGVLGFALDRGRFAVTATSFDWLVVSGNTATVSGTAKVNGASGYTVEVMVTDGVRTQDTARVIVRSAAGAVVYDGGTQSVQGIVAL